MGTTAEKLQAVLDSKEAIKTSLENKGLEPTDQFSTYAGLVDELENTSDATATEESIMEGAVAYTATGRTVGKAEPGIPIVTTEGTGEVYTATVPLMTELKAGKKVTIIPHVTSTSANAKLNVNGLGEKFIRQRLSTNTGSTAAGYTDGWILQGKPVTLMYNGTYWVTDITRTDANTIYGSTKIENGGTGATTAEAARANLGAASQTEVDDLKSSMDALSTTHVSFVSASTAKNLTTSLSPITWENFSDKGTALVGASTGIKVKESGLYLIHMKLSVASGSYRVEASIRDYLSASDYSDDISRMVATNDDESRLHMEAVQIGIYEEGHIIRGLVRANKAVTGGMEAARMRVVKIG